MNNTHIVDEQKIKLNISVFLNEVLATLPTKVSDQYKPYVHKISYVIYKMMKLGVDESKALQFLLKLNGAFGDYSQEELLNMTRKIALFNNIDTYEK